MTDDPAMFTTLAVGQPFTTTNGSSADQTGAKHAVDNTLVLRPANFICAWLGVVVLHGTCAVYLTQLARVYWFIQHPYLEFFARLATGDRYIYLHHASVMIGLVAALHYWQLLSIFWATLQARAFAFPSSSSAAWNKVVRLKVVQRNTSRLSSITASARFQKVGLMARIVARVWKFVFSRHGLLGVESHLFHVVFTVRELVEIVSQTFQASRSSELLSRRWLNNIVVALVVANCWSTPILQYVLRRHQGKQRIACLLVDGMLNMGTSMAVPLAVFWPYYKVFNPETLAFPLESVYSDTWFTRLTLEARLLFSISTADVISKLVQHVAIYSSFTDVATLIHRSGTSSRQRQTQVAADPSPTWTVILKTMVNVIPQTPSTGVVVVGANPSRQSHRKQAAVHLFFFAWGLAVLSLHVRAGMRYNTPMLGCDQATGAWFATDFPCSVYTYSCYRQGTSTPDEASWTQLDKETLMYLTIAHCPALTMPQAFQDFSSLLGITLYNDTLLEWSSEAAISATKHSQMVTLTVARTNLTQIPDGMLGPLPPSLMDIEFSHTDLTSLPVDLHERWHSLSVAYFEHSLLTEFPTQLLALGAPILSLHGNRIESIPELPADRYFYTLRLSSNPIRELPATIGDNTVLAFLNFEDTQVETLPEWTRTHVDNTLFLHDTPYCAAQTSDAVDSTHLTCAEGRSYRGGDIPIDILDTLRPL